LNAEDTLLDLIDDYLNKGMSEEERLSFEEKMASDKTLTEKVKEAKNVNKAIYYASLAELKIKIGQDIKNIQHKPSFNWKKASYISIASLALLSGITAYLITTNTKVEQGKTEPITTIKQAEKEFIQSNTSSSGQEKNQNDNKIPKQYLPANKGTMDTILIDNNIIRQPVLPDNKVQNSIEEPKTTTSETNIINNSNNPTIERKAAPSSNETKVACDKLFKITTEASCKQGETGSILISSDGAYEYTFQVGNYNTSGAKGIFQNIPPGDHEILITYGKECSYTKKTTVNEKWCPLNSSYSFNPDYNEKWVIKYEQGSSGTFIIFDKSGKEIYSGVLGSGIAEWNGTEKDGGIAPFGIYIALINYSDGRKEKVELTIIR